MGPSQGATQAPQQLSLPWGHQAHTFSFCCISLVLGLSIRQATQAEAPHPRVS